MAEATEVMGDVPPAVRGSRRHDRHRRPGAAADLLMERGAREVWPRTAAVRPAIDRLKGWPLGGSHNTLPLPSEKQLDKIEVLSVARFMAPAPSSTTQRERHLHAATHLTRPGRPPEGRSAARRARSNIRPHRTTETC
jgi:hypothetical protein